MNSYEKEDVEIMLKQYKENEAKLTEIELKIDEYEQQLKYAGTVFEDSDKEIIESMQLSGQGFDSVHSNTNKVSDKVSTTAMTYKQQEKFINKVDRPYLERKIIEFEEEKAQLNKKVVRVKNMINPLEIEERFVIETYYMNKSKWDYVEKEYIKEFEKFKSIKRLQKYRNNAIDKMLNILNTGLD